MEFDKIATRRATVQRVAASSDQFVERVRFCDKTRPGCLPCNRDRANARYNQFKGALHHTFDYVAIVGNLKHGKLHQMILSNKFSVVG